MNVILKGVLSFFIGILGGIAFVYLGISASMMLPLVILLKIVKDYKTGIASMLLAIASPISIIPIYNYYKDGDLDLVVGISAFLGLFVGSYITSTYYINSVNVELLYLIFGIYSVTMGIIFIRKSKYIL
jgi:uncharacterized membrane protein YfcA